MDEKNPAHGTDQEESISSKYKDSEEGKLKDQLAAGWLAVRKEPCD